MDTKGDLIRTAAVLFAERGFDAVSVRDIASAANVNLGAITYHFGGKEQLLAAVVESKLAPMKEKFLKIVNSSLDPKQKLSRILHTQALHVLHEEPSLKVLFVESAKGENRLPQDSVESLKMRNRIVATIIREGIDQGLFRSCNIECAVWALFGMIMPYILHQPLMKPQYRKGPYPETFVRDMVDSALDIFFNGLEANDK